MTNSDPAIPAGSTPQHEWLTAHRSHLERERRLWQGREIRWSWARLLTFTAAVVCLYALSETTWLALATCGGWLLLFALAVRHHRRLQERCDFQERLLRITEESIRRCGGTLEVIRSGRRPEEPTDEAAAAPAVLDAGPTWPLSTQERDDLDLYAEPVGLFGLLNRCSTPLGERRLRDWLENPCLSTDRIRARQECARWPTEHPEQRIRLMAAAAGLRNQDERLETLVATIRNAEPLFSSSLMTIVLWWSLPSMVLTIVGIAKAADGHQTWTAVVLGLLALNGVLFMRIRRRLRNVLDPWRELPKVTQAFRQATHHAAADLPQETELTELRRASAIVASDEVLGKLCRRLGWADVGGPIHFVFNLVFFYDVHVARAILRRIVPHRDELIRAFGAFADLESVCSLACFTREQPVQCVPLIEESVTMSIRGGVHPLIEPRESIANDLSLTAPTRTWVVSGSNMAGKSTFLRMAGVNVLLAQIGASATARGMRLCPHRLLTDLRIRDDLGKHESYFLAEVRQLRRMILPEEDTAPVLGLIDEPFRGTNSQERIAADLAVMEHLVGSGHGFVVATHEQRITELADRLAAENYHFHEDLSDAGPVFDYTLRPGPATVRNALRVMEREGYPEPLMRRAREHLEASDDRPEDP